MAITVSTLSVVIQSERSFARQTVILISGRAFVARVFTRHTSHVVHRQTGPRHTLEAVCAVAVEAAVVAAFASVRVVGRILEPVEAFLANRVHQELLVDLLLQVFTVDVNVQSFYCFPDQVNFVVFGFVHFVSQLVHCILDCFYDVQSISHVVSLHHNVIHDLAQNDELVVFFTYVV